VLGVSLVQSRNLVVPESQAEPCWIQQDRVEKFRAILLPHSPAWWVPPIRALPSNFFELVNLIVEEIGLPKRQADNKRKIAEKYQELPENARRGIQSRDGKA
jgi:hypothetical protein